MLVLTRQVEEAIVIGGIVKVRVLDCRHGKIKLGIEAPPEVIVDREEIHILKESETDGCEHEEKSDIDIANQDNFETNTGLEPS